MTTAEFRAVVWRYYRAHGRHDLPWRKTRDPYKILVSEVMLQQTQVERVIPFYAEFTRRFPTVRSLAQAPLSDVLKCWQGLGYNRRAKLLRSAAKILAMRKIADVSEFEKLPGVGPYTARAIAAFAYDTDVVFIETNIRTAVIHHFFATQEKISDAEVEKILKRVLPEGRAREWYSALMDYGARLKRSGNSHNARSNAYAKQSRFAGSLREARGAILRELSKGALPRARLSGLLGVSRRAQATRALKALQSEGLVRAKRGTFSLAD
ncbi:TPA: endonuclease III [Candidatus Kaiserbacteria bacterium]|nr:endonuclease III [Candidatus Kaiserbacteria bacterium]